TGRRAHRGGDRPSLLAINGRYTHKPGRQIKRYDGQRSRGRATKRSAAGHDRDDQSETEQMAGPSYAEPSGTSDTIHTSTPLHRRAPPRQPPQVYTRSQ